MSCVNHPNVASTGICIACGKAICNECKVESGGELYCKKCIAGKVEAKVKQAKSPVLAAFMSFFIAGLGQIYNGQAGKGLLIFFTSWLIIPWIYGIIDAYQTADKINAGTLVFPSRPGCAVAAIVVMLLVPCMIVFLGLMAAIAIPSFVTAREAAQSKVCQNNLKMIAYATKEYTIDNNLPAGDQVSLDVLIDNGYLQQSLICPNGGKYDAGSASGGAICSIGDRGTKRPGDDHILVRESRE